ncbi:MAG: acetylglutamate kinase [Phycisphaera sp.]|nr:MAG: acetylglutamate kinase [Phycisphaera sp.]
MSREILLNLLHNLGGRAEVDRYLREYTGTGRYAVVKVGGGLVANDLEELSSALVFMHQVGLTPVVVHGGGPQLTDELASSGIETQFVDGLRVTTPEVLGAAQRVFQRVGAQLADAIDQRGIRARPLPTGVFEVTQTERSELGHVGDVTGVYLEAITRAEEKGQLPILSPVGTSSDGRLLNINADSATRTLALALGARKVIFLTPTGGILDRNGSIIPALDCTEDLQGKLESGLVSGGMARKLVEIRSLLDGLDEHASVSITSPAKVARELFTHRGSGTLVRQGRPITVQTGLNGLDRSQVAALLEQSFGRHLDPSYLETVGDARVYVGGEYAAIAIVKRRGPGWYLDKLALSERAQGIGLGASLWNRIVRNHQALYWRSRTTNEANKWYLSRADGMQRAGEWLVFWYGMNSRAASEGCVADALSLGHSFGDEIHKIVPGEPPGIAEPKTGDRMETADVG